MWPFKTTTKTLHQAGGGWWPIIREPFMGAWQRNKEEKLDTLITYPALYACVRRISEDIGKLPFRVQRKNSSGIWQTVDQTAAMSVLSYPNNYQLPHQFREAWSLSRLIQGNTYVLKVRNDRGGVRALQILNPWRVLPLVSDRGNVFYRLYSDDLANIEDTLVVPASEIIHDRCITPFHPLIGIPPVAAANLPALKGMHILRSASEFFSSNTPPGILVAPGPITEQTATTLKERFNKTFADSSGVVAVGDGLKFEPLTMKSVDAQMLEQLKYSDEQICQVFGIPPFKVGIGTVPTALGVDGVNQLYYTDALQAPVQSMEHLLTDALATDDARVDMDESYLMRMDAKKKAEVHTSMVQGSVETINDARANFNLSPLVGGDTVYMQQQDYPLDQVRQNVIQLPEPPKLPQEEEVDPDELAKAFAQVANQ